VRVATVVTCGGGASNSHCARAAASQFILNQTIGNPIAVVSRMFVGCPAGSKLMARCVPFGRVMPMDMLVQIVSDGGLASCPIRDVCRMIMAVESVINIFPAGINQVGDISVCITPILNKVSRAVAVNLKRACRRHKSKNL